MRGSKCRRKEKYASIERRANLAGRVAMDNERVMFAPSTDTWDFMRACLHIFPFHLAGHGFNHKIHTFFFPLY